MSHTAPWGALSERLCDLHADGVKMEVVADRRVDQINSAPLHHLSLFFN
jgi:hypothetical protein